MTSKGIVANINYVMKLRLLFGFYHNVFDCNYKRYLMKTLFIIFGVYYIYTILTFEFSLDKVGGIFSLTRISEYMLYFICSLKTADKYIFEYYTVDVIENKIFLKNIRQKINFIIPCYFITIITFHVVIQVPIVLNCVIHCDNIGLQLVYYSILRISNEFGRLPIMMTFILFYFRVKIFCKTIYEDVLNNTTSILNWKHYVIYYIKMLETLNKTDWPIKFMVFDLLVYSTRLVFCYFFLMKIIVHLTTGFIDISILQLHIAKLIKQNINDDLMWFSSGIAQLIYFYAVLFFPSIIMEMITEHINVLKVDIANRMITCTDERRRANLRQLLKYFREQPLKYCIWRIIPIDSRLPLHYLSLAATYLVCLMQLTHLLEN